MFRCTVKVNMLFVKKWCPLFVASCCSLCLVSSCICLGSNLLFFCYFGVPYVMLVFCVVYFPALKKMCSSLRSCSRIRVNVSFFFYALCGGSHDDVFPSFSVAPKVLFVFSMHMLASVPRVFASLML